MSTFLSRLACRILSLTDKHGITLIPAYIPTHLNVGANYLSQESDASGVASSSSGGSSSFSPLGPFRGGSAGIFSFHSMPSIIALWNLHYLWGP